MSQLADVITKESVHRLHEAFLEGVLELERTPAGDLKLNANSFEQVGEPIVRFIHTHMWEKSRPNDTGKYIDFPRVTKISVNGLLAAEGIEHTSSRNKNGTIDKTVSLGGDVSRLMQHAGIALYRRPLWYLKPYSSKRVEWADGSKAIRPDHRVEKRIEEEAKKAEESLKLSVDLRQIQRPKDFTPEAVAKFIEAFVPAALKVQDSFDQLTKAHAQLLAELEAKSTQDNWREIAESIGKHLG